ncbi:ATP-binding cassette domain-containing protein [Rhizobium sp. M1]|uniref:ATP-binding cassette domain-containing protein n=1 Tax=Rhizobium sp. M1 TaxID=2035453 RepID=UPI0024782B06|nr:ATP-binding cassette domain-containing protein [Rhizobium sp. M1]
MADSNLSIKSLRAGYGSLDILNGVDLDVPAGQFVALMGPNGAGKSTLLKTLYGMTTIKDGSIDWRGNWPPPRLRKKWQILPRRTRWTWSQGATALFPGWVTKP